MRIVNYFEVAANFELAPVEALAYFNAKGLKPSFAWQDMLGDEHDLAFTVAKMMDMDLLATVKGRLDSALENGDSLGEFKRELIPELQKAGWWGKADVIDPKTGEVVTAQLGSASRLETIFRTNLQSAYSAGRWQAIMDQADTAPYLLYDAVDDHRTRPEHQALDGLVLKVGDPFWDSHSPPNGWNCRCGVIQLDDDQLADYGLNESKAPRIKRRRWVNPRTGDVHKVPTDLDPGWDHNPGKARYQQLKALAAEKAQAQAAALAEKRAAARLAEAQVKIDVQVEQYKAKVAKLKADQPALKGKLAAQAQKLAQSELDYHLAQKTPYLAQAIKQIKGTKAGQALTPAELLSQAQDKALVIKQSAHLSAFKAKSISGKPISAKQQAVFDALPEEAQQSILADIDAKTGTAAAKAQLQQIADLDADGRPPHQYASTKADLLAEVPDWQNHPDPKALLAEIEAEGNLQGAAGAQLFEHETLGTPYLAQALKSIKKTQAGKDMKPTELLAAAEEKAKKLEQSAHLSSYKAKSIAGKQPSDKAKAAFAALPEEAQASITDDIQAKLAAQAENAAALDELALIAQGQAPELPGIQKSILAKIEADLEQAAKYPEPVDLLQAVQAQAVAQQAKATIGTLKSGYKKKAIAGHIPTPKQKAMFDALPDEEKVELLAEIDAAKAAQAAPEPSGSIYDDAVKAVQAEKAADLLDQVQASPGAQAALQANVDQLLDGHKHQLSLSSLVEKLTGDMPGDPTVKQTVKYIKLAPEDQAKIDALVIAKGGIEKLAKFKQDLPAPDKTPDKAPDKPAPSTPEPTAPVGTPVTPGPGGGNSLPALDDLTQIGGQGGSNPGGLYQDTKTGTKWYIKKPQTADHAKNEVLTGKLCAAAGVEVVEMYYRNDNGDTRIYSKVVDNLEIDGAGLQAGTVKNVQDNFMVDAWLANWDVVGMGYDNLKVLSGRAVHLDTGAGLLFRAQGTPKGSHFGDTVGEIESLRDAGLNPQAAATFKHLTHADEVAGARKVLSVDEATIKVLVEQYGPGDATAKAIMVKRLLARQAGIAKRYPEAVKKPKLVPAPKTTRVSEMEYTDVLASRINGMTLATDKDQIEDQSVLLWSKRNAGGEPITAGMFKVRGKAQEQLGKELGEGAAAKPDYNDLHKMVVDAIISIRHRIKQGQTQLEGNGYAKAVAARDFYEVVLSGMKQEVADGLRPQAELDQLVAKLGPIMADIEASVAQKKPIWNQTGPNYAAWTIADAKDPVSKPGKRSWKQSQTYTYQRNASDRSFHREGDQQETIPTLVFTTQVGNATVRFFPGHPDVKAALRGRVQIEAPGESSVSAARVFEVIEELGIDSSRAGLRDQERLYLAQLAYIHKLDQQATWKKAIEADDLDKQKALIEKKTGVSLANNPHYRPEGEHQAFNHGRRTRYRPELLGSPEWATFEKDYRVVHDYTSNDRDPFENLKVIINGGGQMAPTADKLRRGVPIGGMSPGADMATGGASYFFTRLRTASSAKNNSVVWKARVAARVDAISYNGDKFGRVFDRVPNAPHGPEYQKDWVQSHRKTDLDGMRNNATIQNNEVIVKDSLSLFDDLEYINAKSPTQRKDMIKWMEKQGYKEWPDGRPLNQVIRYQGKV